MAAVRRTSTADEIVYNALKILTIGLFCVFVIIPLIHVLGVSLMNPKDAARGTDVLWPRRMSLDAYRQVTTNTNVLRGMGNSIAITITATVISLVATSTFAYVLSKKQMVGNRLMNFMVVFTMLFQAGLVPLYLVVKTVGILNSYLALLLPLAINPFWCILMRNFYESMPQELMDNAEISGCSELQTLWYVAIPLSKASFAAFALFYAVFNWNAFFHALMFISDSDKWPIQVWLRQMITNSFESTALSNEEYQEVVPETIQMAIVVTAMVPILLVYPFLQKHFAKGVMLGSVKG